jgi:hydroxymethylpyrimidine pyrophosphatase-like HAD family hydrolase
LLGLELQCVDDFKEVVNDSQSDPTKFLIVAEEAECDHVQAEMDECFGQRMNIVRSHRFFVEGNPLGVNKGDALRRLTEFLSIPQRQTVAIGDQGNDVPMITWAGLGLAMGNGSKIALAAADWVAPSVSEDGAAVAIERFLLR